MYRTSALVFFTLQHSNGTSSAPDGPIKSTQCWAIIIPPFTIFFRWMCLKMNGTPAPPIFCMFVTGKNDDKPWEIYGNIRYTATGPWDLAQIPGLQKILRFASPLQSPFALLCPRRATMALHRPCPAFGSWRIFNFGRWERDCNKDDPQDLPLTRYRTIRYDPHLYDDYDSHMFTWLFGAFNGEPVSKQMDAKW